MNNTDINLLDEKAKETGITLSKRQLCQFYDYFTLLVEWNDKINLTAITKWEDVVLKHFIDSLSIVKCFNDFDEFYAFFKGKTLADIGTGAGFPGIPLKILVPELNVTLMDSLEKRVNFLNTVCKSLELSNISAVHGRVEDLAHLEQYREKFDFSTARAVAALPVLSEYCLPFVKTGGCFIAYKSEKAPEEIEASGKAISILGGKINRSVEFLLPDSDLNRNIILINKVSSVSNKYPRKAGVPSKKPL